MDERYRVFVGKNVEYYEEAWKKEYSWNWASFLLGCFWLSYRKMFKESFIFITVVFMVQVAFILFLGSDYTDNSLVDDLVGLSLDVVLGFIGNKLYKNKAERTMIRLESLGLNEEEKLKEMERRGGVSKVGILFPLSIAILYGILFYLIDVGL